MNNSYWQWILPTSIRRKQPKLEEWLKNAEQSKIRAIKGFAVVKNGVTLSWSNQ
ncbi:hypothetical protein H1P_6430002 [Hyella patelloides LEGE 07179]|uniref:Uncharacterized protein n=1 Tax=Hyella patelloides LEGE 07179 TaxID=945734 RepID=A0A563W285_9CYAN|nr:hypothetical protein [Hyella patelloides]VEP17786.1 hypothetical protein H1P_6430002 [Hyella patelloides LEGE 07179]